MKIKLQKKIMFAVRVQGLPTGNKLQPNQLDTVNCCNMELPILCDIPTFQVCKFVPA